MKITVQLAVRDVWQCVIVYVDGAITAGGGGWSWGLGVLTPWKYVGGARVCFDPVNVTFFHSKLSLDNSASFTSSTIKDLCQKYKVKLIFSRHLKQFDGLTWLTPTPPILQQIFAAESDPKLAWVFFWPVWNNGSRNRLPLILLNWPVTNDCWWIDR